MALLKYKTNLKSDIIWDQIAVFTELEKFVPGVASCELVGLTRTFKTLDGLEMVETIKEINEEEKELTYTLDKGPFPIKNYIAKISVQEENEETIITWSSSYDCEEEDRAKLQEIFQGIYENFLSGMEFYLSN